MRACVITIFVAIAVVALAHESTTADESTVHHSDHELLNAKIGEGAKVKAKTNARTDDKLRQPKEPLLTVSGSKANGEAAATEDKAAATTTNEATAKPVIGESEAVVSKAGVQTGWDAATLSCNGANCHEPTACPPPTAGYNAFTKVSMQSEASTGTSYGGADITYWWFQCKCSGAGVCARDDALSGVLQNVQSYFVFNAFAADSTAVTSSNTAATVDKIAALFQQAQQARSSASEKLKKLKQRKLGEGAGAFPGFGSDKCSTWPTHTGWGVDYPTGPAHMSKFDVSRTGSSNRDPGSTMCVDDYHFSTPHAPGRVNDGGHTGGISTVGGLQNTEWTAKTTVEISGVTKFGKDSTESMCMLPGDENFVANLKTFEAPNWDAQGRDGVKPTMAIYSRQMYQWILDNGCNDYKYDTGHYGLPLMPWHMASAPSKISWGTGSKPNEQCARDGVRHHLRGAWVNDVSKAYPGCDANNDYKGSGPGCELYHIVKNANGQEDEVRAAVGKYDILAINDAVKLAFGQTGDGWDMRQTVDGSSKIPDGSSGAASSEANVAHTGAAPACTGCGTDDQNLIPSMGKHNYPRLLEFIRKELMDKHSCDPQDLPFRISDTAHTNMNSLGYEMQLNGVHHYSAKQIEIYAAKEDQPWYNQGNTGMHKGQTLDNTVMLPAAHMMVLLFPCAGPEGSGTCVAPEKTASYADDKLPSGMHTSNTGAGDSSQPFTPWEFTKFNFVYQLLVPKDPTGLHTHTGNTDTSKPVIGRSVGVPTFTWDCDSKKLQKLAWCKGKVTFDDLDSIIRQAIGKMRFAVSKAISINPTRDAYVSSYKACTDQTDCNHVFNNHMADEAKCWGWNSYENAFFKCRKSCAHC